MAAPDPQSIVSESPSSADNTSGAPPRPRGGRSWVLLLAAVLAGLAAGTLAWAAGELKAFHVEPVERQVKMMGFGPLVPEVSPEAVQAAILQNSVRAFAILGALTAFLLGLVGGLVTGSRQRAVKAGAVGLVLGSLVGACIPLAALPLFQRVRAEHADSLIASIALHAAVWVPIGAVAGQALALGVGDRSRWIRAVVGGALGALLATIAFEALGASLFPLAKTDEPISATAVTRLLARLLVATFASAGAAVAVAPQAPPAKPAGIDV